MNNNVGNPSPGDSNSTDINNNNTSANTRDGGLIYGLPVTLGVVGLVMIIFAGAFWNQRRHRVQLQHRASLQKKDADDQVMTMETFDKIAPETSFAALQEIMRSEIAPSFQSGSHLVCAICLDQIDDDDVVRRLPCGHVFHSSSIAKWFQGGNLCCPLCITPLNPIIPPALPPDTSPV
ncbi:hypothetical protein NLU13_1215 [Sarocladium strictum]|uniref:RING-type domain-containing protein n=1 Tax=Sarocladium strictum TaxID=5046 RepID=A0AA39GQS7_SARSR|nr:hypothetical protein NLU13_1215 [Sarocladium strictum]